MHSYKAQPSTDRCENTPGHETRFLFSYMRNLVRVRFFYFPKWCIQMALLSHFDHITIYHQLRIASLNYNIYLFYLFIYHFYARAAAVIFALCGPAMVWRARRWLQKNCCQPIRTGINSRHSLARAPTRRTQSKQARTKSWNVILFQIFERYAPMMAYLLILGKTTSTCLTMWGGSKNSRFFLYKLG